MNAADIPLLRLARHRIASGRFERPEEVVHWMGAMQAQEYAQALWGVGLRTRAAALVDVEQAIAAGKIIRTWPLRGTIHFVAAQDAGWITQLNAARLLASAWGRHAQLGLDEATFARSQQILSDALSGGRQRPRREILTLFEQAGISTQGQRGYHLLWRAAMAGLICMGPVQDKQQTFALLHEWVPNPAQPSREEGLAELARRYLNSHAPATVRDFAWWSGLTLSDARAAFAANGKDFTQASSDGEAHWLPASAPDAPARPAEPVYLLPGFDEYLLGYTERSAVLASEHAARIAPGGNGMFRPMLVVDGHIVGVWTRMAKKRAVEITLSPFVPLTVSMEPLNAACQRYSDFLGMDGAAITVEPVA